ncbi:MAG: CHAT domain-containing protein, partial [Flavitalea sp.]
PAASVTNNCERWIIIPDGLLYYLPMGGLASDANRRKYVIEDHTISYHYSLSLLFQKDTHLNKEGKRKTVAFAPYTSVDNKFDHAGLASLPYSKNEVMQFSGNSYLAKDATKKKFLEVASDFPFLHLATHASAGSDSTGNWIQFYPSDSNDLNNKLFLNEIYNLNLHQAELVILSACETGSGNISSGEGLLSLSRAFLYAGSDGIISTLWKSEDQLTAFLMQRLHYHLNRQKPPEKALQLAKIDLLREKNISSKYKTPNYWSNFIYVGKVNMQKNTDSRYWWIPAFAGLMLFLFVIRKKVLAKARTMF